MIALVALIALIVLALPAQAAAAEARAAVVCVRAEPGQTALTFSGRLVGERPHPGAFEIALKPGVEVCNTLLRSKVATWSLGVAAPGRAACALPAPVFGQRVTYGAKTSARGLVCAPRTKTAIGTWE